MCVPSKKCSYHCNMICDDDGSDAGGGEVGGGVDGESLQWCGVAWL